MDLSSLCRSCMKEVAKDGNNFNQDTVYMFTFCTNIPVKSEEQLPRQFCNQCTSTIQSCYKFVYTARDVDQRLKDMIGMVKSILIPDNSYKLELDIKPSDDHGLSKIKPVLSQLDASQNDDKKRTKYSKFKSEIITGQMDSSMDKFKTYICMACDKGFVRKKNYKNHMFRHHSIGKLPVMEEDIKALPKESVTSNAEDNMVPLVFSCPHCAEKFVTSKDRQHHKREKHRGQLYECSHCPQRFAERQLLTAHIRKHKQTKQLFSCHYCNKVFKVKSRLKFHLHIHDDSLKPHLCDICGSRYSHRQAMLNHQLVHTGQKPFTCDLCGYMCRQASNIRRHNRAHLNERKHQCVECGKGFNELSALKKHMYSHTDERPYKCPNCDNCYKNSDKRKKHLVRVHGMDPSDIPRLAKDGGPARRYVTDNSTPRQQNYSLIANRVKKLQKEIKTDVHPNT